MPDAACRLAVDVHLCAAHALNHCSHGCFPSFARDAQVARNACWDARTAAPPGVRSEALRQLRMLIAVFYRPTQYTGVYSGSVPAYNDLQPSEGALVPPPPT
ncbi:hypothetical protein K270103H11_05380 [Gordonibacter urolithinfaciens]